MKQTAFAVCACLLLAAASSLAQDRSTEDTQTKNAAPSPAQGNGTQGDASNPAGNTTQNSSALQSGHAGEEGAQLSLKQCQDLTRLEAKSPNMERDPAKDKACAQILDHAQGDAHSMAVGQNRNAVLSGHQGAEGALMTRKECQDLATLEAKNPNLQRDTAKDRACTHVLGTTQAQ
jgi:hypothetical protein